MMTSHKMYPIHQYLPAAPPPFINPDRLLSSCLFLFQYLFGRKKNTVIETEGVQ